MTAMVELMLPPTTRSADFLRVLARILNHPVTLEHEGWNHDVSYANVVGIRIVGDVYLPTIARLRLLDGDLSEPPYWEGLWEYETATGYRSIALGRSEPLWCAAGDRLLRFFGGYLKFDDEGSAWDRVKNPVFKTAPGSGDAWDAFQQAVIDVAPLSMEEVNAFRPVAAYDEAPDLPPWLALSV